MAGPVIEDVQTSQKPVEEDFDFAETSDLCDFGYVLVAHLDPTNREVVDKQPA